MEFNKIVVLIISFSTIVISLTADAKCVPRSSSNNVASKPAKAPQASTTSNTHAPTQASPPPIVTPEHPLAASMLDQFESSKAKMATIFKDKDDNNFELTRLCGLTDNPQLCAEVAGPFLKGVKDPLSVLHAVMEAARDHLQFAINEAKKFASDASSSGLVKKCMNTCLENYDSALSDFDKSFKAIEKKDFGSLNSNLDSALTTVSTCEETFDENPGVESPMREIDRKLSMMIDNCLAIRNAIKDLITPPIVV